MRKDKTSKSIDEIPEKSDFVLEVTKDQPHWILLYGNLMILIVLLICLFLYFMLIT